MSSDNWQTLDFAELKSLAKKLYASLKPGDVVALYGDLGTGKTTFVKHALEDVTAQNVSSPTFTYLHLYNAQTIAHFDLYRLETKEQFMQKGFLEYLEDCIAFVEWPEIIESILPEHTKKVYLEHLSENTRRVTIL